ncbi:MAG TPA: 4-hydroxyphenylpyruvate dioxygenase [Acidimicrobiia bacterium]|nr:4-hydroxyphenylpyruvate dioxygenase [Acidimicrobiia bacterium]
MTNTHGGTPSDPLPIKGFHHVEFWVGNAYMTAQFFRALMGFSIVGYRGPETGARETASWALRQGDVRFVVSGALYPEHPISHHVHEHGPGVHDVALEVTDAAHAFQHTVSKGAEVAYKPEVLEGGGHSWTAAGIKTYGETVHSLIETDGSWPPPDFEPMTDTVAVPAGLTRIDHVVGNVPLGEMDRWVSFYEQVFGFVLLRHFDNEAISTEYSALMSKVVWDGSGLIKLPINEPATGRRRSQIEEYLDFYRSAGVQHIAIATDDIFATVSAVRDRGLLMMNVPDSYYGNVPERVDTLEGVDLEELRRLNILIDQDEGGTLLQIFTRMLQDRPTVFFEYIERRGAVGFGEGNFKALFEAIERDQAARGNL